MSDTPSNDTPIPIEDEITIEEIQAYQRFGAWVILGGLLVVFIGMSVQAWFVSQDIQANAIGKMGVHLLLDDGRNRWDTNLWAEHMAYAGDITSENGIAVQVIRSNDLDPTRWQVFMDLANEHSLTPVLRLATTFDNDNGWWLAPEPDADGSYAQWGENYATFINSLEWHSDSKHVILLNETNNGHEWGGVPDPAAYANFVVDVSNVLRREVEGIVILNGAFDLNLPNTNGEVFPDSNVQLIDANSYMDAMEVAQPNVFARFDIWNSHPYALNIRAHPNEQVYGFDFMNGASDTTVAPPEGIYNRGINGYLWERWKLEQLGYNVADWSVMLTETGWRHSDPVDPTSADSAPDYPSPEQVAEYYRLAFNGGEDTTFIAWNDDARVIAVAPFALNGVPEEWSHTNLLRVASDGTVTGTYTPFDTLANLAGTSDE
ncbi:MAG: hypothetical protein AAFQ07_08790 [Chloroflexota bacterium]